MAEESVIDVVDLTMAYGDFLIQKDLSFSVRRGEIFIIMGGSGCGKSTLLMHLIGLQKPAAGEIRYSGRSFWQSAAAERGRILQRVGVLFQSGALFSSMTLAENVALPLTEFTDFTPTRIRRLVAYKLALVGLAGFEDYYPAELSGGMQKRAGLARAMALDPDILYFDEPSAGLDPITSKLLDDLIQGLCHSLGATVVVVTHELPSILAIGDDSILLDAESRTAIAHGPPRQLLAESRDPRVIRFLTRGTAPASSRDPVGVTA